MNVLKDYEVDIEQYIGGNWVLIGTLKFPGSSEDRMNSTLWKMGQMLENENVVHFREQTDSFIITVANGPIRLLTYDPVSRAIQQHNQEISAGQDH